MVSEQEHDLSLNDPLGGFPVYNIVYAISQIIPRFTIGIFLLGLMR